jgi:hypothetical protein
MAEPLPSVRTVYGVDFSGARLAGRTIWIARAAVSARSGRLKLVGLASLEQTAGTAERAAALAYLVRLVRESHEALWAIDAPFGLPVEVMDDGLTWADLMAFVRGFPTGAYDLGLRCLDRAKRLGGPGHVYRTTDRRSKTPFSCYHYRIIYQTFHVMRDVLWPLLDEPGTAVLPFQYGRLPQAERVVVEACPSSTLKRMGLPHQGYKQPGGKPVSPERCHTRAAILAGLAPLVHVPDPHPETILRDPGGDALDAVIAAVGAMHAWRTAPHDELARDARTTREGFIYA